MEPKDMPADDSSTPAPVRSVLFLCTANSARSILAEALLRDESKGRFAAYSAGSRPRGAINPDAVALLKARGHAVHDLASKSWNVFAGPGAPAIDLVITVCDNAAGEACPIWPGHPLTVHWGIDDPAAVQGADPLRREAFERAYMMLRGMIRAFLALPLESLDRDGLRTALQAIGRDAGIRGE